MADFEMQLAPLWIGHISWPQMGYFQGVSGLFEPPPIFIIIKEVFDRQSHALARIIRGRYLTPHSPRKMADFGVQLAPLGGVISRGPKMGYPQGVSGLF